MPSSKANGTQTAVIGTEHPLATVADSGTYILQVNTSNMAYGDILELRVKVKTLTGGAEALYQLGQYAHVQVDPVKVSIPCINLYSMTCTLKQTAGTGRTFEWNIVQA